MKIDEVVKALGCCCNSPSADRCKDECVFYRNDLDMSKCIGVMGKSASELIEQLQAENEQLKASQPVRCGECVHYVKLKNFDNECGITGGCVCDDDYCSYGERIVEE